MKHLRAPRPILCLAAALTAAACFQEPLQTAPTVRDQLLDQAFGLIDSDPDRAARLFAEAGPGAVLENARMTSWSACLERTSAPSSAWRQFLAAAPPPDTAAAARLRLIEVLIAEGDATGAAAERELLHNDFGPAADEMLLATGDQGIRLEAAKRLCVTAPRRLTSHDTDLDRRLFGTLDTTQRLERSRAWRRAGSASRAAAELRSQQWRGEAETERRRELARAELEAGSPRRALRALPNSRSAESADLVLRARAHRLRAWTLWPAGGAKNAFADCRSEVDRALALNPPPEERRHALVLRLECATETGALDDAFDSWRRLEAAGWSDPRREWLGRRLGVALAVRGGDAGGVREIARTLPYQTRCLQYWMASTPVATEPSLEELATAPVPDLYASWALETLGRAAPTVSLRVPPIRPAQPPSSVQRLLDAGAAKEAAREWRRIRRSRRPAPAEALAGAQTAAVLGQTNDAIRWLRFGFPELGTVAMTDAPENVIEAYLPLRWRSALMAAAAEFGLDPWLVAAVSRQESTFTAHAVSPRGAVGAMQLLPSTAAAHARALGIGGTPDLRDAEVNLRLGARELAHLLRRFGAVEPALAAYNGGESRVRKWWKRQPDRRRFTEEIPIPETYTYVRRVIYLREAYRQVYENPGRTP